MKMKQMPIRVMYPYMVALVCLFVMAFVWFGLYYFVSALTSAVGSTMTQFENMTTYPHFALADTFMTNVWMFFLAIVSIALLYWIVLHAQRKGEPVYR